MNCDSDKEEEVKGLREEIEADLCLVGTSDWSSFHAYRLESLKAEYLELTGEEYKVYL